MELIGPLQVRVMHHIWSHGPSTVHDVHDALMSDPLAKRLAYTTVLTVMRNLRTFLPMRIAVDDPLSTSTTAAISSSPWTLPA